MQNKSIFSVLLLATISSLSGCLEEIKEPKCSDLKRNDAEMLKKQEEKYPDLMKSLRDKCPNQSQNGSGGYQPSTATKGLIR